MKTRLDAAGFQQLDEREEWALEQGKGYYAIRNGSSIIAFRTGKNDVVSSGVRMVGAHTDSPRSEEHTSELQSRPHLVCRLLLEKKKKKKIHTKNQQKIDTIQIQYV